MRLNDVESATYEKELDKLVHDALERLDRGKRRITSDMRDFRRQSLSTESLSIEDQVVEYVESLGRKLQLPLPRSFALTKGDHAAYESYIDWLEGFTQKKLEPAVERVRSASNELRDQLGIQVSRSERARHAIDKEAQRADGEVARLASRIRTGAAELKDALDARTTSLRRAFLHQVEALKSELQRQDLDQMNTESAVETHRAVEIELERAFEGVRVELQAMLDQVQGATEDIRHDSLPDETIAALEGRIGELEEQLTFYNDLAQAGSAVSILGHELDNVVSGLRAAIRDMKPWADGTPELDEVYQRLRTYYDHIDSYVGLFAPLTRRVRRKRVEVTGASILNYVAELFNDRLERTNIEVRSTAAFKKWTISSYRSTLIAAVVNVVDNAVYWIGSERHSEPWIEFDTYEDGIIIRNGGPGVPRRAAKRIFEYGMSNKPGGRGMGLAVSREALASVGLSLELLEAGTEMRPAFVIRPDTRDDQDD